MYARTGDAARRSQNEEPEGCERDSVVRKYALATAAGRVSAHASPTTAPAAVIRAPRHVRHVSRHAGCLGCGSNGIVFLANTVVGGKVDESQQHAFKIEKCHFPTGADGGLPPLSRTRAQHTLAASGRASAASGCAMKTGPRGLGLILFIACTWTA